MTTKVIIQDDRLYIGTKPIDSTDIIYQIDRALAEIYLNYKVVFIRIKNSNKLIASDKNPIVLLKIDPKIKKPFTISRYLKNSPTQLTSMITNILLGTQKNET